MSNLFEDMAIRTNKATLSMDEEKNMEKEIYPNNRLYSSKYSHLGEFAANPSLDNTKFGHFTPQCIQDSIFFRL